MKHLWLIRHAKSSWSHTDLADHDRPLGERGLRDAPRMGRLLKDRGLLPDALVSSTAVRALSTARLIAHELNYPLTDIHLDARIYEATESRLLVVVRELDPAWEQVCMFGHNPGFTYLSNEFKGEYIDNVPTCGIVHIQMDVKSWKEVAPGSGTIRHFFYPKMLT